MSKRAWIWGLSSWAALRIITSAAAAFSSRFLEAGVTVPAPGYSPPAAGEWMARVAGVWLRADALWYLKIAEQGYGEPATLAFYPAFPMLVRILAPIFGGNELVSALFVSSVACALGLALLYELVTSLAGERAARAATVGLALFPTAFFLVAPYAEPVLLAAGAGCLLLAARGRPLLAGVLGFVAALSRPFGVLLSIVLAVSSRRARIAALGPVLGAISWYAFAAVRTGDPLFALRVQGIWQRQTVYPLDSLWRGVREALRWKGTDLGLYFALDVAAAAFLIALIVVAAVALRNGSWWPGVVLYGVALLLAPLASSFPARPLLSLPRFALAAFPLFAGYSVLPSKFRAPLAAVSGAALFFLTALYVAARPIF